MKIKYLLSFITSLFIVVSLQAGNYYRFVFSDTAGDQFVSLKSPESLQNPEQVCTNACLKVGSNNHTNNGVWYTILGRTLYTNGVAMAVLHTDFGIVSVGNNFGWDIDTFQQAWIICQENDGSSDQYMFQLDLETAHCTYYSWVAWPPGVDHPPINGLVISQFH